MIGLRTPVFRGKVTPPRGAALFRRQEFFSRIGRRGQRSLDVQVMLRIHFLSPWLNLSDSARDEVLEE